MRLERILKILVTAVVVAMAAPLRAAPLEAAPPPASRDYGHLYWKDGLRNLDAQGRQLLCIQTGYYGLVLDILKPQVVSLGALPDAPAYEASVPSLDPQLKALPPGKLNLSVTVDGKAYKCVSGVTPLTWNRADARSPSEKLEKSGVGPWNFRIFEYGRYFQRVDIDRLGFVSGDGSTLNATARFHIEAWPDVLMLSLDLTSASEMKGVSASIEAVVDGQTKKQSVDFGVIPPNVLRRVPLVLRFGKQEPAAPAVTLTVQDTKGGASIPAAFDDLTRSYRVNLPDKPHDSTSVKHFDDEESYAVTLDNPTDSEQTFRVMFHTRGTMGSLMLLRDGDGQPTALNPQSSRLWLPLASIKERTKDLAPWPDVEPWDYDQWFHSVICVRVPAKSSWSGHADVIHEQWGGVPKATFYQLSLFDWGCYTHWEVALLGGFGENCCFSMDSFAAAEICDVRPFYVQNANGQSPPWQWTPNLGGGNYIFLIDPVTKYRETIVNRRVFGATGPNAAVMRNRGVIDGGKVAYDITYTLGRTDDMMRDFHHIVYDVLEDTAFDKLAFFQRGAPLYECNQPHKRAWGNGAGLTKEETNFKLGEVGKVTPAIALDGPAPWWVSLHDSTTENAVKNPSDANAMIGNASRGIIIRKWDVVINGQRVPKPLISFEGTNHNFPSMMMQIVPPDGVRRMKKGDRIEIDIETDLPPARAKDYLGPNAALRASLPSTADRWQAVYRQAKQNDIHAVATTGKVLRTAPLVIEAGPDEMSAFTLENGLAYQPVTICGLRGYRGYTLYEKKAGTWTAVDQAVNKNDFWQTDYDSTTGTYSRTYNLQLDATDDRPRQREFVFRPSR